MNLDLDAYSMILKGCICASVLALTFLSPKYISANLKKHLAVILLILSILAHHNFFYRTLGYTYQRHDFFHYYIGGKYFNELGYTRLYVCALTADKEDNSYDPSGSIRDLRTYNTAPAAQVVTDLFRCKEVFSPERWKEFKGDISWFRNALGPQGYAGIKTDHGFNTTPIWVSFWGPLLNRVPLTDLNLILLSSIDTILLAVSCILLCYSFGLTAGALTYALIFSQAISTYRWIGASCFRYDWLAFLIIGISLIKLRRIYLASFFLTTTSLFRIFPGFVLIGSIISGFLSKEYRRDAFSLLIGGFLTTYLFLALCFLYGMPHDIFHNFINNSLMHIKGLASNFVGVDVFVQYIDDGLKDPVKLMLWIILLSLWLACLRKASLIEASIISCSMIPIIILSNYYYCYFPLLYLLSSTDKRIGIFVAGISLSTWFVEKHRDGDMSSSYVWSIELCMLSVLCLISFVITKHQRSLSSQTDRIA